MRYINLIFTLIFFVFLTLILFSCKTKKQEKSIHSSKTVESVLFTEITQGGHSNITETSYITINELQKLKDIYTIINKTKSPNLELPTIDFNNEMLIALFMGNKNSGGYKIEIDRIFSTNVKTTIYLKEIFPKGMVTQVETQPFYIAKIKRVDLPIEFVMITKDK